MKSSADFLANLQPDLKHEKPVDQLDKDSIANWQRIPADIRQQIVLLVQSKAAVSQINHWRDQHRRGISIGSDDPLFHMSTGMAIRNACRGILVDDQLPFVKYDDGNEYQNWDDFYHGMLDELAGEVTP